VTPQSARFLEKARKLLVEADTMLKVGLNDAAGRTAYLAGYHVAQAFVFERLRKVSKTHNGVQSEFLRLTKDDSRVDPELRSFLSRTYNLKAIADDMDHAYMPIGPIGKPTELHLLYPILAMNYTKYPQACKALMAFMLESDNFNKWLEGSVGYLTHCLNAYDTNPVWTADPKRTVYRDVAKRTLTAGGLGSVGEKAAAAIADFVVVDMFASFCTGREDGKGAMKIAERQLQRIYR